MKRWFPAPALSFVLFVVWILLNQSVAAGTLLLGLILAVVVPVLTRSLRPANAVVRRPLVMLRLGAHVIYDLLISARDVARLLLTHRTEDIASHFVTVPLDMRDPSGLAVLAMIFCLTPGTAWAELSRDRSQLRVHMFDLRDDQAFINMVKSRYERPLMEIFGS
ncbi:Na+/H+ antiporter subunit E [Variovorax dokdonensis]|uniref:Na+/H+ antiporter subunit E n=1 Tax=Variovorax dokdonensis TaxID=344883 RepID=A0ABT7NC38_9BURK|nr:Na+/H+ antiporter subunit E [Variovorax dokdonensis]MDM0045493.1 Na+/H+ antiporter subunit E [Variovorax dokdonensis]